MIAVGAASAFMAPGRTEKIGLSASATLPGSQTDALGTLTMKSGCVSTSGIYEKGAEVEGVYYHHIIDSRTGYPSDSGIISATVLHQSGAIKRRIGHCLRRTGEGRRNGIAQRLWRGGHSDSGR